MKTNIINFAIFSAAFAVWAPVGFAKESVKTPSADAQASDSHPSKRKYNYAVIEDGATRKVIVSGYNRNASTTVTKKPTAKNSAKHLIAINPMFKDIPSSYKHYPPSSVIPVNMPVAVMMGMKSGESVTVDLPVGQYVAVHDSVQADNFGNKTWVGHLAEAGVGYRMIVSEGSAGVMGHVNTPKGTFNIEGDTTSTYLVDTRSFKSASNNNDTVLPPGTMMNAELFGNASVTEPSDTTVNNLRADEQKVTAITSKSTTKPSTDEQKLSALTPPKPKDASTATPSNTPVVNTEVDLMVLYTTTTTTADFAKQRIQYLVTTSNQAYKDSGINMTLRLVYTEPTTYSETTSNAKALDDLASDLGAFKGTQAKRAQYGADLVFLFRPLHANTHGSCGTTYVQFARGEPANSAKSFGTIGDGVNKDGNTVLQCGINVFTHEIGHSFGLVHDAENSSFPGAFSFSYAWGIQDKFATIMSYKSPIIMLFSTPTLKTECASLPCSIDDDSNSKHTDQVKSMNLMAPTVAAFMPTMTKTALLR